MQPKNIVCLHGFTQNKSILEKKLSTLLRGTNANYHYLDGPIILNADKNERAYWIYDQQNPTSANWNDHYRLRTNIYGLEESMKSFIDLGNSIGGVDGIIGFSQGGCFADYICEQYLQDLLPFDLKFAIFISARPFAATILDNSEKLNTLHIYGKNDTIIPYNVSLELSNRYKHAKVITHDGTHIIKSNSECKTAVRLIINNG